jgi:hypothetical protein
MIRREARMDSAAREGKAANRFKLSSLEAGQEPRSRTAISVIAVEPVSYLPVIGCAVAAKAPCSTT